MNLILKLFNKIIKLFMSILNKIKKKNSSWNNGTRFKRLSNAILINIKDLR